MAFRTRAATLFSLWITWVNVVLATRGRGMESDARYYRRRAIEERMAAQRAVTEQARAWHAKLAQDFAQRANGSGNLVGA